MKIIKFLLLLSPLALAACGGSDNENMTDPTPTPTPELDERSFRVTVTNTTANQPLSPLAIIAHDGSFTAWSIGEPASAGLEILAESGSPTDFLAEATNALDTAAGDSILPPGNSVSLDVDIVFDSSAFVAIASMLVNTNDAFTGAAMLNVGNLELGDSMTYLAPIYDAGTESNSETAATIPGPAGGGEGFNAARETRDQVTRHPGVVTHDDGYSESALDQSHRFDNGAMLVVIERTL